MLSSHMTQLSADIEENKEAVQLQKTDPKTHLGEELLEKVQNFKFKF